MISTLVVPFIVQAVISIAAMAIAGSNFHDHVGSYRYKRRYDKKIMRIGVVGFVTSPFAILTVPGLSLLGAGILLTRAVKGIIHVLNWEEA